MSVSSVSSPSPAVAATERLMLTLKKSEDVREATGQALVALINAAPAPSGDVGTRLNVYA